MEFDFSINKLFGDVISKVDHKLMPYNRTPELIREHRFQLMKVLDKMGDASAKAQNLYGPITSAKKLERSHHHVYIMKDAEANSGKGAVIGFIKVGQKKLFVYDHRDGQHEMEPLCVLDFYVHESRQRKGCGKRLFQHMLQAESVKPHHLAIDRPSNMFTGFLHKHYGLKAVIPQVNNFVVYEGFFKDRTDFPVRGGSAGRPPTFPYRRPSGYDPMDRHSRRHYHQPSSRPPSGRRENSGLVSRTEQEKAVLKDVSVRPPSGLKVTRSKDGHNASVLESLHLNLNGLNSRGLGANINKYSRHTCGRNTPTPPPRQNSASRSRQNSAKHQGHHLVENNNNVPSGDQSHGMGLPSTQASETTPPLLRRRPTSVNIHDYMSRDGHLKLTSHTRAPSLPNVTPTSMQQVYHTASNLETLATRLTSNTTWTVFGVIPSGYNHGQFQDRKYHHTRLW